jgi:ABC-2 type transport system ATP-binding protein
MFASLRASGRRDAPLDVRSNPEARSVGLKRLDCFVARAPRNDGLATVILRSRALARRLEGSPQMRVCGRPSRLAEERRAHQDDGGGADCGTVQTFLSVDPAPATSSQVRMPPIISVKNLSKTYGSGFKALNNINLDINRGEIFALLGPNGAGKTTLISIICGIANLSEGTVTVDGHDINGNYRAARSLIGLVPQELHTDAFESVWGTVSFSRGLFGKPKNPAHIEKVLKDLSLWDKKDAKIVTLSGGMKRRVMIAKALSHEPQILFLDEPTAGVDVELRKGMWEVVRALQSAGVTIILTTHYIEEAEEMADRIGVINKGEIILVEEKAGLMQKLGKKRLTLHLQSKVDAIPAALAAYNLELSDDGRDVTYNYDTKGERTGITSLLSDLRNAGIRISDLDTSQSSLEDIFVSLVRTP